MNQLSILGLDSKYTAIVCPHGEAVNGDLEAGAGLATEAAGVASTDGVEELAGLGIGIDGLAKLLIRFCRERCRYVGIGHNA